MSSRKSRKSKSKCGISEPEVVSEYFNDEDTTQIKRPKISGKRVEESFYHQSCEQLAKCLLGKILVRKLENGSILRGIIVETESYIGGEDLASKSYGGKVTPGNKPMFMSPGTAYVYFTYGMYHCFNISSEGEGAAVLLRAVEPLEGIDEMQNNRKLFTENLAAKRRAKQGIKNNEKPPEYQAKKITDLCNGPSKLCISFDIDIIKCNECNMVDSDSLWIETNVGATDDFSIVSAPRIGIDSAGPIWANKLLRFYILGSDFVSRRNKVCEKGLNHLSA